MIKQHLRIIAASALALVPALIHAQFSEQWAVTLDGGMNLNDHAGGAVTDSEGNVYMVGTVNRTTNDQFADIGVYKLSPDGRLLWRKTYDGSGHSQDIGFEVALCGDGTVVVAGRVITATTSSDLVTLKYRASDGELLWDRTFDGPAHSIDQALDIAADDQGNVYVTGEVWNDAEFYSNGDYVTVKYAPDGTLLWSTLYDGPATFIAQSDQPVHLVLDHGGDVLVTGDSPDASNATDIVTVKYDGITGAQEWAARYDVGGTATGLQIAPNNDVIVAGNTYQSGDKIVVIRYDSATGSEIWAKVDVFPHDGRLARPNSLAIDAQGNPVIALDYDPDADDSNLNDNLQTTKYDFATGERLWSTSVGTSVFYDGQDVKAVAVDGQGNVMVAGSNLIRPRNPFTVWYFNGSDGSLISAYDHQFANNADYPVKVLFDADGNAIAVGDTFNNNNGIGDMVALKYRRLSGARPLAGRIGLQDYSGPIQDLLVRIEMRSPGTAQVLEQRLVLLRADGSFSFQSALPSGTYDVTAKASHWLRKRQASVFFSNGGASGIEISLTNGDINGDNVISLGDYSLLRQAFGTAPGSPAWNPMADLNGDGTVSLADYAILRLNFGGIGD